MSLNEPNRPTPNTYVRQVIDQVQRQATAGLPPASFAELCSRASIPHDLRQQLLHDLLDEQYIVREGDHVRLAARGVESAVAQRAVDEAAAQAAAQARRHRSRSHTA